LKLVKYRAAGLGEEDRGLTHYTSSIRADSRIVDEVVLVTIAHVYHLYRRKAVPKDDAARVIGELQKLYANAEEKAKLTESGSYEDVFEAIEGYLESRVGRSAHYMPLGRSRNDHVVAALKLRVVREVLNLLERLGERAKQIIELAESNLETPFIAHTHSLPGQASTYAHYLGSLIEELVTVSRFLLQDLRESFKSPLGSCAGAGTSADISREELADLLGFEGFVESTLFSTGSRIFLRRVLSSLADLSVALSRIANDYIMMTHPSVGLVSPPLEHVQTSSVMPQKKNLATLEVARARLKKVFSNAAYLAFVESGLPSGYSLDLQELTPAFWESLDIVASSLDVILDFVSKAKVERERVVEAMAEGGVLVVDVAEGLSIERGIPFREAHQKVAAALREAGWDLRKAIDALSRVEGVDLAKYLDWKTAIKARKVEGSPNPEKVLTMLRRLENELNDLLIEVARLRERLDSKRDFLLSLRLV